MDQIMPYIWIAVIIFSVLAEALTASLVAIWFVPPALITMILAFCKVPITLQIIIFLLCSALFIVFSRIIFKNTLLKKEAPHTNADAVIGEKAIITERVCNIENKGLAKVRGQIWSARSADGEDIEVGTIVSVISIQGVKLICRKIDSAENKN
jgi:membrane protein implicated in regulation of membrane protease activity